MQIYSVLYIHVGSSNGSYVDEIFTTRENAIKYILKTVSKSREHSEEDEDERTIPELRYELRHTSQCSPFGKMRDMFRIDKHQLISEPDSSDSDS